MPTEKERPGMFAPESSEPRGFRDSPSLQRYNDMNERLSEQNKRSQMQNPEPTTHARLDENAVPTTPLPIRAPIPMQTSTEAPPRPLKMQVAMPEPVQYQQLDTGHALALPQSRHSGAHQNRLKNSHRPPSQTPSPATTQRMPETNLQEYNPGGSQYTDRARSQDPPRIRPLYAVKLQDKFLPLTPSQSSVAFPSKKQDATQSKEQRTFLQQNVQAFRPQQLPQIRRKPVPVAQHGSAIDLESHGFTDKLVHSYDSHWDPMTDDVIVKPRPRSRSNSDNMRTIQLQLSLPIMLRQPEDLAARLASAQSQNASQGFTKRLPKRPAAPPRLDTLKTGLTFHDLIATSSADRISLPIAQEFEIVKSLNLVKASFQGSPANKVPQTDLGATSIVGRPHPLRKIPASELTEGSMYWISKHRA